MNGLETMKFVFEHLYQMMNEVELNIFDVVTVTLWQLFLYGALAGVAAFAFNKFIRS